MKSNLDPSFTHIAVCR